MRSYKSVYPKCKDGCARRRVSDLLKKEPAQAYLSELLSSLPATKAVNPDYVISGIKKIAESANTTSDRLRAYELLGRYLKLFQDTAITNTILTAQDYSEIRQTLKANRLTPTPPATSSKAEG